MPAAEIEIDEAFVAELIADQMPDLVGLPVERGGEGFDAVVFRLGSELAVRIPRRSVGAELMAVEHAWLPALSERLPLPVPTPIRFGRPTGSMPWPWALQAWIPGERALDAAFSDPRRSARRLGRFVSALAACPVPEEDPPVNQFRGCALDDRATVTERHLEALDADDRDLLAPLFEAGRVVAAHDGERTWLHGDLHAGNLVVSGGEISGVIDFGDLGVGDPAVDLMGAWVLFDREARRTFRSAAGCGDARWARARAWAAAVCAACLAASDEHPDVGAMGRRWALGLADD